MITATDQGWQGHYPAAVTIHYSEPCSRWISPNERISGFDAYCGLNVGHALWRAKQDRPDQDVVMVAPRDITAWADGRVVIVGGA